MKNVVVRNIDRADAGIVKRFGALGTSTVHEAGLVYVDSAED